MSLKAFHIVFIAASIGLAFGLAVWCLHRYSESAEQSDLIWGCVSGVAGVALIFYGRSVLKKLKKISML